MHITAVYAGCFAAFFHALYPVGSAICQLYHYESKSRGLDESPAKRKRFASEVERFQKRWAKQLAAGDPCMNPNFDLMKEDFSFDIKPLE